MVHFACCQPANLVVPGENIQLVRYIGRNRQTDDPWASIPPTS